MSEVYDLAIIGSGFGGSLLAMVAQHLGLSVLLLEKGQHPRFAIGESTSPLTNLLIEELAHRYDLPRLLPLTSFGPWQRNYPKVVCGMKRGFTYYHHTAGETRYSPLERDRQLLVAASPNEELADTHWLRSDVDFFLVKEAITTGVVYRDRVNLDTPTWDEDGTITLSGYCGSNGTRLTARTRLVVDATGPRGFLSRALKLPETSFPDYPNTQALFSHFTGVRRCGTLSPFIESGSEPPYPPDDAALHHIFDGGWMWVLRFGNGVTSAGVAITGALAKELRLSEGAEAWPRILRRFPNIQEQFADAEATQPWVHIPRLSYRTTQMVGPGWVMLPSAAAFIDPLFSTGFPLTLLGIERLAHIFEESWGEVDLSERLAAYGEITLAEVDATADFIGGCYAGMRRFPLFSALSMFYFAAASYSEIARRLGKTDRAKRYLLTDHPTFGKAMRACADWVGTQGNAASEEEIAAFAQRVAEGIQCLNIAGLCDPEKRNWYGVNLNDLIINAEKLGISPDAMKAVLTNATWAGAKTA